MCLREDGKFELDGEIPPSIVITFLQNLQVKTGKNILAWHFLKQSVLIVFHILY